MYGWLVSLASSSACYSKKIYNVVFTIGMITGPAWFTFLLIIREAKCPNTTGLTLSIIWIVFAVTHDLVAYSRETHETNT